MNRYDRLLFHILKNDGDKNFIKVSKVFDLSNDGLKDMLNALAKEGLIVCQGGYHTASQRVAFSDGHGNITTLGGDKDHYVEHSAKITFKGINYLEEKMSKSKNSVKISAGDNANISLNVGSPHSIINANKQTVADTIKDIKTAIANDASLETTKKIEAIQTFNQLEYEIHNESVLSKTIDRALTIGSNISSIASLFATLLSTLPKS